MKRRSDRRSIRSESISCDLKRRSRCRLAQAFHEDIAGRLVALAHRDVENELRMAFYTDPHVAVAEQWAVIRTDTLLLLRYVAPNFVAFQIAHYNVANASRHDALALLASKKQELQNRGVVNIGCALDTRHAITFEEEPQNRFGLLDGQIHAVQRVITGIRENLAALLALVALAITALSKLSAFRPAIVAGHSETLLEFHSQAPDNGDAGPIRRKLCWIEPR